MLQWQLHSKNHHDPFCLHIPKKKHTHTHTLKLGTNSNEVNDLTDWYEKSHTDFAKTFP